MIPGFQILIQPTTGVVVSTDQRNFDPSPQVPLVPHGQSDKSNYEESICEIKARLDLIEHEVFRSKALTDKLKLADCKSETLSSAQQDRIGPEFCDIAWSVVFDKLIQRLDMCAGQSSLNQHLASLLMLRKELSQISEGLQGSQMTSSDHEVVEKFLTVPNHPPLVEQHQSGSTWWRSSAPRSDSNTVKRPIPPWQRSPGPCHYCPCPEWRPGHTCEGSRLAQQRKKERECRDI